MLGKAKEFGFSSLEVFVIGQGVDIGFFLALAGIDVENGCVVSALIMAARSQGIKGIIVVLIIAVPTPIEVQCVVGIIAVANEGVTCTIIRLSASVQYGTTFIDVGF